MKPTTAPAPAMSAVAINELAAWSADLVSYLWLGKLFRPHDRLSDVERKLSSEADQGVGPYQATSRFSKFMNDVLALSELLLSSLMNTC